MKENKNIKTGKNEGNSPDEDETDASKARLLKTKGNAKTTCTQTAIPKDIKATANKEPQVEKPKRKDLARASPKEVSSHTQIFTM